MILLNTGIGLMVYGSPFLLIGLTISVSIIETAYLNNYPFGFAVRMKKLLIANTISTSLGLLFICLIYLSDSLRPLVKLITEILSVEKFSTLYSLLLTAAIAIPCYLITIPIEFVCLKKILWKELKLNDILIANLISYGALVILWLILTIFIMHLVASCAFLRDLFV